jgi:hypothetical protein
MAMKKIKPQYGKVVPPVVQVQEEKEAPKGQSNREVSVEQSEQKTKKTEKSKSGENGSLKESAPKITSVPNPFLQTKDVFAKANLTKIGYRMRTEYVEVLDIIKKMKKGGYTLEAVLDDALTHYFENSEDGREALKKAELFYS